MDALLLTAIALILTAVLSVEAFHLHCLTKDGAVASTAVGFILAIFGSFNCFFLLTFFSIMGFLATMKGFEKKKAAGLHEGQLGERSWKNVIGVGLPPCTVTVFNFIFPMDPTVFMILFVGSVCVAMADTIASEIGVHDPKVWMITTFERVEPGVNGGVSVTGTVVSTFASLVTAAIGWLVFTGTLEWTLLFPFIGGVFGNIMDSVLGAVLENKGYISKYANNASTEFIGALFCLGLWFITVGTL